MRLKATKSGVVTFLLLLGICVIGAGFYALNPQKKTTAKNEPVATETPTATPSSIEGEETETTSNDIYSEPYYYNQSNAYSEADSIQSDTEFKNFWENENGDNY